MVVVGAGPAGAAAAIALARAGRRVVVLDKATFPRDKCCGDGLTTLALRELEPLGFVPAMVPSWQTVSAAWVRSPGGNEVTLPLPSDGVFAATAPRRELDAALMTLARRAGADVRDGCELGAVEERDDHIVVSDVDGHRVAAAYVLAADGMWSPTRRLLGVGEAGYRGEWHAARQYVSGVTGAAADRLHVWFEHDLGAGYAWSFPLPDGRANVGFGVLRSAGHSGHELRAMWDAVRTRPHIVEALGPGVVWDERMTAWPIPAGIDRATLAHGRTLFAGDAARAADVMTGEGIGQALLTARLAVTSIVGGDAARPALATAAYERAVRRHLLADHRTSKALTAVVSHARVVDVGVRLVARGHWSRHAFARWMFEDAPRHSLVTPWRWRGGDAPRPGAFV